MESSTMDPESEGANQLDPTAGVTYSWRRINVYAPGKGFFKKGPETHILKEVSGVCRGGDLLAIMGASGAGKTTLLNVLTYRSPKLRITGDISINGRVANPETVTGISAYVQQEDLFTGVFTVREQLEFQAQLRIGKEVSASERKARVEIVLKELGLKKCQNTLIGIPGRIKGISGGEKKRLQFACELITNPLMLLCDEPTSGLDSFMAQNVMQIMKHLSRKGKTVLSTIHQPSSEVFAMFDKLMLLAEGRVAFLGTVDEAFAFFSRLDRPCPVNFNPGDHFIHKLAIRSGEEDECRTFISSVCDSFRDNEGVVLDEDIVESMKPLKEGDALAGLKLSKSPYRASWLNQFMAVGRRAVLENIRDPLFLTIKLAQAVVLSLIFGLIYLGQDSLSVDKEVANISGALFTFVTNMSFSNLFPVVTAFSAVMPLFLREHWNGLYRTDVYFLTRNLVELPIFIMVPFLFISINYFMVGFRDDVGAFFTMAGIFVLIANTAVSYGYMISCMAKNYQTAIVLSTPLTFPLLLFGGFYMKPGSIPVYLEWLSYLSWFQYGFETASVTQWTDAERCLNLSGFSPTSALEPELTTEWTDTERAVTVPGNLPDGFVGCGDIGGIVLDQMGFSKDSFGVDIGAMIALMIGYRFIAYLLLLSKTYRKN